MLKTRVIGPDPFEGRRLADRWGIHRPRGKNRKIERGPIEPLMLNNAATLTDTWQKPNIMDGINTTAEMIKTGATEASGGADQLLNESVAMFQDFQEFLSEAISSDFDEAIGVDALLAAKKTGRGNIPWERLVYIARQHGWKLSDKESLTIIKERLTMNTQYKVSLADLAKWFDLGDS